MFYLFEFQELNGGYVSFRGNPKGGKISGKGKIKTGKLDFEDVYFGKELKFNLFSVSQMCDKKNKVLFTDTGCLVLFPNFKLLDESQVLLRVPRGNNMYNINLKDIVPFGDLTCLYTKATIDESNLWHRSLGHINFKTINKLVKGNLVRGLPTKVFENNNTCVACKKGKQHMASCKTKPVSFVNQPLFRLHMDLFGSTFVKSLNKKSYCLVITDDYSRFTWVFFLATKDETSPILKTFITVLENQISLKVKVIRSDNGTEFKNSEPNDPQIAPSFIQSTEQVKPPRPVSADVPKIMVTQPRLAHSPITKSKLPIRRYITRSPSPKTSNSPPKVTAVKASVVSAAQAEVNAANVYGYYCLKSMFAEKLQLIINAAKSIVTNDYSRFTWVFFLATKNETSPILKTFITGLENQLILNVKVIRNDNGIEFKNNDLNQFCRIKGIKREFSVPRTPQQNGIAERKNRTIIEAAKTMLADSLLPIPFWADAVNTACYV
nr:putative ribonuclease H-like domain-containing protein [Tanacetum cinerariifolium]